MKTPFSIQSEDQFTACALQLFRKQFAENLVYHTYCSHLNKSPENVSELIDIPFLPIQFFKSKEVYCGEPPDYFFSSSGTTGSTPSKHYIKNLKGYENSFIKGFQQFYGDIEDYCVLALLPSYLERQGSSLIYMVQEFIKRSKHPSSGFYLNEYHKLKQTLEILEKNNTKTLLIGVSFALLDFVEQYPLELKNTIVIETGGMKGRRKELIREELHQNLCDGFGVDRIHSEYGMTELLSQAYSKELGIFQCPPWMKVFIRDSEDPLDYVSKGKTGGLNVIDLANTESCAFIATEDLGREVSGGFEVLGRFDHSEIRGCNLLVIDSI